MTYRRQVVDETNQDRFRSAPIIRFVAIIGCWQRKVEPKQRPVNVDDPIPRKRRCSVDRFVISVVIRWGMNVAVMRPADFSMGSVAVAGIISVLVGVRNAGGRIPHAITSNDSTYFIRGDRRFVMGTEDRRQGHVGVAAWYIRTIASYASPKYPSTSPSIDFLAT